MTPAVLRADARALPLPDASVDLVLTSPPFWAQRDYRDGGQSLEGQIGREASPADYVAALLECTAEWVRVLKPGGSLVVNIGDKYGRGSRRKVHRGDGYRERANGQRPATMPAGGRDKCMLQLPARYAIACTDQLGLLLRAEVVWSKGNWMPESVRDRFQHSHESVFHFTLGPRYYHAMDDARLPYADETVRTQAYGLRGGMGGRAGGNPPRPGRGGVHPLGAIPGSVWTVATAPLVVPADVSDEQHHAAFPPDLIRPFIVALSPAAICSSCGMGREPVTATEPIRLRSFDQPGRAKLNGEGVHGPDRRAGTHAATRAVVLGYSCACTPFTDHPGTVRQTGRRRDYDPYQDGDHAQGTYGHHRAGEYQRIGPWREYHLDRWQPPAATPGVVVDPFGGTGTTALVADTLGRRGVSFDLSASYGRIARWRTTDPGERARALQVPKPEPEPDGQGDLFSWVELVNGQ